MVFNCVGGGCTFGDLIPFLQIAFGVNVLFSAWDGIYAALTKSHRALQASDETLLGSVDASPDQMARLGDQRARCEAQRKKFRQWGRWGGFVAAFGIALALLLVAEETSVNVWGLPFVVLSGFGMPAFMLLMFFAGSRCVKRITAEADKIARETAEATARAKKGALDLAGDIQPDGNDSQG